jgi:hypothetical protein
MSDNIIGTHNAGALLPPGAQSLPIQTPHEPPIFSVVKFRIRHSPDSGRYYDYAAIHAGDGKWYLTGGETKQGVSWEAMCHAIKPKIVGPIVVMAERIGFML